MSGLFSSIYGKLKLGNFVFDDTNLETPEELEGVTDNVLLENNVFPGGYISQKTFGTVPAQIRWRGYFSGSNALDRVAELRALKPDLVDNKYSLTFLDRLWTGTVSKLEFTYLHEFRIRYICVFDPSLDAQSSGVLAGLDAESQAAALAAKLSLHIQCLQALIGAVASGDFDAGLLVSAYAPTLLGPVGSLISSTIAAVGNAKGLLTAVTVEDQATVTANGLAVLNVATPLSSSADPKVSSAATDVLNHTNNIVGILSATPASIATITIVNPNLLKLAAIYYGDQSKWTLIASANGITDPQPGGTFNALVIPEPS